jgi:hypothetical protein
MTTMPYLQQEFHLCFQILNDILDGLEDIRLELEFEGNLSILLSSSYNPSPTFEPTFDPMKTIGKYE